MPKYRLRTLEELPEPYKYLVENGVIWYTDYMDKVWELDMSVSSFSVQPGNGFTYLKEYLIEVEEHEGEGDTESRIEEVPLYPKTHITEEPPSLEAPEDCIDTHKHYPGTEIQLDTDDKAYAHATFILSCEAKDLSSRIEELKRIISATLQDGEQSKYLRARL